VISARLRDQIAALNKDAAELDIGGALYYEHADSMEGQTSWIPGVLVLLRPTLNPRQDKVKDRCKGVEVEYVKVADLDGDTDILRFMEIIFALTTKGENPTASYSLPATVAVRLPQGWLIVNSYVTRLHPADGVKSEPAVELMWRIRMKFPPPLRLFLHSQLGSIEVLPGQSSADIMSAPWPCHELQD
jgi:hypothetical protein